MTTRIRFLGVAAFEIEGPRQRILMDPFLTGSPTAPCGPDDLAPPDVILVSHPPIDHLGDTAEIARRTGAVVVCGADSRALLIERGVPAGQIRHTIWGIRIKVGDLVVHPVECRHWSGTTLADGSRVPGFPLSFVVETEPGVRIYHSGDTAVFDGMGLIGRIHRPTVGLMGCSQPYALLPDLYPGAGEVVTGEMDPDEAAIASELLGVRWAVASHFDDPEHPDVRRFVAAVGEHDTSGRRVPVVLEPGSSLVIDGEASAIEPPA